MLTLVVILVLYLIFCPILGSIVGRCMKTGDGKGYPP